MPHLHLASISVPTKWPSCMIIPLHASSKLGEQGKKIDQTLGSQIQTLLDQKLFIAAPGTLFHVTPQDKPIQLVILIGVEDVKKASDEGFYRFVKQAMAAVQSMQIDSVGLCIEDYVLPHRPTEWKVQKASESALNATYRFTTFKSSPTPAFTLHTIHLLLNHPEKYKKAMKIGAAISSGMTLMRDLGHTPPNICNPDYLAAAAKNLAKTSKKISCNILDEAQIKKLKMGGIMAVSQGSREKPRFIILNYQGGLKSQKPIVLIGKGVCFDSGGLSLKQPLSMVSMKFDMCGGASLLGTLQTISQLALPINVVCLIPAVTNMPDQDSYRPDDVVTTMSGLTVEITNTDAEGRMILCDAITYSRRYKPRYVIDVATLTGAIIMAMGHHRSGLFSNDATLETALFEAGEAASDLTWRFPLDSVYYEPLKSPIADMVNAGEAAGARSITSACFLANFAENLKWAHLDIAGIAMPEKKSEYITGRPVPLLVEFLMQQVAE